MYSFLKKDLETVKRELTVEKAKEFINNDNIMTNWWDSPNPDSLKYALDFYLINYPEYFKEKKYIESFAWNFPSDVEILKIMFDFLLKNFPEIFLMDDICDGESIFDYFFHSEIKESCSLSFRLNNCGDDDVFAVEFFTKNFPQFFEKFKLKSIKKFRKNVDTIIQLLEKQN